VTFLTVFFATALGTVAGNGALLWFIGRAAKRNQQQQIDALAELQSQLIAEQQRMEAYARMES